MRIALAAGGTGGHLIPALNFASWVRGQGDEAFLMTGSRPLEEEICSAFGEKPQVLPMKGSPFGAGLRHFPRRFWALFQAYRRAKKTLREHKPDLVLVFGGYLSFPVAIAALQLKLPLAAHEQNAVAGKVTRLLRRWGVPVFCGWPRCDGIDQFSYTGTPVRDFHLPDRAAARKDLFGAKVDPTQKVALVLGGSLGSQGLAEALDLESVLKCDKYCPCFMGLREDQAPFEGALTLPARWDMSAPYAAADLVICRAGGATLAEVASLGLPALVLPWEKATDGHQLANAQELHRLQGTPFWQSDEGEEGFRQKLLQALNHQPMASQATPAVEQLYSALQKLEGKSKV